MTKKTPKDHLTTATKHPDDPQGFWENILWTDKTKAELSGSYESSYIWHKTKTAFHFIHVQLAVISKAPNSKSYYGLIKV